MSDTDHPYMKELTVNGVWRIDPANNPHREQVERLDQGVYFVGYWSDGRVISYAEADHTIALDPVRGEDVVKDGVESERDAVQNAHIEQWVRENIDNVSALHPRYCWISEVVSDE